MRIITSFLFVLIFTWHAYATQNSQHNDSAHANITIQSEVSSVARGDSFWLALTISPKEGWQHFWQNSGGRGKAPALTWSTPDGISVGAVQFPTPSHINIGHTEAYGYASEITVIVPIYVADDYELTTIDITLSATWMFCSDTCTEDTLSLSLLQNIGDTIYNLDLEEQFTKARSNIPNTSFWSAEMQSDNDEMLLLVHMAPEEMIDIEEVFFFPDSNGVLLYGAEQNFSITPEGLYIRSNREAMDPMAIILDGILSIKFINGDNINVLQKASPSALLKQSQPMQQFDMSIIELILYALLGGLILNLMPCVFPVLSLKALALLRSHESHRSEGWAYTVGILASFILIAITMIIIRAGGETIGWGFQLQEPKFVGAMVFILLAVGLSLSGFYTIQFGFESSGNSLTKSSGIKGSFFTGVLAALVATPCTAPFMAPAIGYAITQPMHITFIGFLALGFGLALPFLLLSYFPVLSNILPKPGPWMEKLKEALAFPMYITAAWLIWVFTNQAGSDATLMLLIGLILFAFAIWLWQQSTSKAVHILSVAVIIGSIFIAVPSTKDPTSQDVLDGEPYSEMRLNTLKKEGRRVFVYFSADWCITCKVNEQVSLYSDVNRALVFERNIAILKGDWTNRNETIAKVLASHKRMGVPLYLYYASGMDEPIILPEILGPNSVTDIFKEK